MRIYALLVALGLGVLAAPTAADEARGLTEAEFKKLREELRSPREAWQAIPWHLSILEARAQAAKEKKPVYMLARAGHPLGCV